MKTLMSLAAWRTLTPENGGGGGPAEEPGAPAPEEPTPTLSDIVDAAVKAAPDEEPEDGAPPEEPEEPEKVADAEPEPKDEEDDTPPKVDDSVIPDEIIEKYPAVKMFTDIEAGMMNPETATETARHFLGAIAGHHGKTIEQLLGIEAAAEPATPETPDWEAKGFATKEEYDAQPEYTKAGFDSPGEHKLATENAALKAEFEALKAQLNPVLESQKQALEAKAKAEWEGAIAGIAPKAIAALKAELGWEATPEQALEAARKFPELASKPSGLSEAIKMAHVNEIVKAAGAEVKAKKPKPPEMPVGGNRPGANIREAKDYSDLPGLVAALVAAT